MTKRGTGAVRRERVQRELATAAPVPLHLPLYWSRWHRTKKGGLYPPIPMHACGLYEIRNWCGGSMLYVGESHTNRLRKTCIRHFQSWSSDWFHDFEPRAVFDPSRTELRWLEIPGLEVSVEAGEAAVKAFADWIRALETAEILKHDPKYNRDKKDHYLAKLRGELDDANEEEDNPCPF